MYIPPMYTVVPEGQSGNYKIEHFDISESEAKLARMRAVISSDSMGTHIKSGRFAKLTINSSIIMSDAGGDRWASREAIYSSTGNVLIAGLGIGMILTVIVPKVEV